jgi:disulfide bond formation protein DsbB
MSLRGVIVGNVWQFVRLHLHYFAWFQTALATMGSLFFSEVMSLPPCVLCWYQRIAMYPLVIILAVSILRKDGLSKVYGLPLALVGFVVAVYHNLLYYKIIPDSITPCTSGVSCTVKQIEWLGFITIPLLSLLAFCIVIICLVFQKSDLRPNGEVV